MRIEYSGTQLKSLLKLAELRPIDFVYLNSEEFADWEKEADEKNIIKAQSKYWFTINDCEIVFYLENEYGE